jgi:hypothetical protein
LTQNHLRCTLTGSKWNSKIKCFSKQLNKKYFSTLNTLPKLNPWFVSGLADGESSFSIAIIKDNKNKSGWRLQISFKIGMHAKDISLIY